MKYKYEAHHRVDKKGKRVLHLLKASHTEDVCDSQDAVFLSLYSLGVM